MTSLYTDALLERAKQARYRGLPAERTIEARFANPLCGDVVVVAANIVDDRVTQIGFEADACAVCIASASIMAERLSGAPIDEIGALQQEVEQALEQGAVPEGSAFEPLVSVAAFPSRRSCVLLPWRALELALLGGGETSSLETVADELNASELSPWVVARDVLARGELAAIATLVAVDGSSPCPVGSRMVVSSNGNFWGSVSGGCVETAVVQASMEAMGLSGDGVGSQVIEYQISNSQAGEVGLPCGGRIQVHVAPSAPLAELERRIDARDAAICVTNLTTGLGELVDLGSTELAGYPDEVRTEARRITHGGAPLLVSTVDGPFFVELLSAPWRLVMVGGTHIAQKLSRLAAEVGLTPVIVDPRGSLANASRFPGVEIISERPETALPRLLERSTAVVMLTHDKGLDDPALQVALASEAYYVAALGSRKTQKARLERLREAGLPDGQLARLRGPAGLAIGAKGAGEIALSILAEVVAAKRLQAARDRHVGAVVLAAGSSRRAGSENKLLREHDGVPMVRRVTEAACEAGLDPCIVVLGHEADAVREALDGLPVEFVLNEQHADGMGRSIAVGVSAMRDNDVDAAMVILGDMPLVRTEDLERLAAAHQTSTEHLIIAPEAGHGSARRLGNPVLWPRRYFAELAELRGDSGGKSILLRAPGAVLRVPIEHDGVLRDFDT